MIPASRARRRAFLLTLIVAMPLLIRAQSTAPKPITLDDYAKIKRISNAAISTDGRWMVYTLAPNEGDGTLVASVAAGRGATAAEAVASNNAQTQKVVDGIKKAGVDAKDIRTMNFSIYPNTQYDPQTNQKLSTTYVVDNTVYVTVRKLADLGTLLDAAVQSGANNVNSIQFDVSDKNPATKQARDEAIKDAKTQAQELASAAGVSLGTLQQVSFANNTPIPPDAIVRQGRRRGCGRGCSTDQPRYHDADGQCGHDIRDPLITSACTGA